MRTRRSYNWHRVSPQRSLKGVLHRLLLGVWSMAIFVCLPHPGAQASAQAAPQGSPSLLLLPTALVYDTAGNLFIADANRHQVFEATLAGTLLVVAGTGTQGFSGDGGPAALAQLNSPAGLAFGSDGTLYIADTGNARIRAVSGGTISTFAGTGTHAYSGDGGPAGSAAFRSPTALAMDASGGLLVCDAADHRIRRIAGGSIATFAGNGVQGFLGDGAQAVAAELDTPAALAIGADGRVFIADSHNQRIRVIDPGGTIRTFAGTGQRGFGGDGDAAQAAQLASPRGLALLPDGTLLIADMDNGRVRAVTPAGVISTLIGSASEGEGADDSPALSAALHSPRALAISGFGMPVVADTLSHAVRVLTTAGTLYQPAALAPGRLSSLAASVSPSLIYGSAAALLQITAPVGQAQGRVTLQDAGTDLASTLLTAGQASFDLSTMDAGTHTLTATYAGDGLNPATKQTLGSVTIAPASVVATVTPVTETYGAPLPAFSGTLTGVLPADAAQVSASFSVAPGTTLNVGTYPVAVTLTGPRSANYTLSPASISGTLTVVQASSRVAVASLSQAFAGLPTLLSANVNSATSGDPTGTVQFMDGTNVIRTATLVHGAASATYTAASAGTLNLSARYSGDPNFTASSSLPQTATISPLPDFGVALTGPSTATVNGGTAATFNLLVSSLSGAFTGVVTFSVGGLPTLATANFSPVQVVPGTASATVTATVLVPALAMHRDRQQGRQQLLALAGMGCGALLLRRRKLRTLPLLAGCLLIAGCGARTVGETTAAASQIYTLQVTGTSTNLAGAVVTHAVPVTLTVQN